MLSFGLKDIFDILIVASLLYYLYKLMKESGTINIFYGVLAFVAIWVVASVVLGMRMMGLVLDKVMGIGLLVLVIIFQDQIKRFLVDLGSKKRWRFLHDIIHHAKGRSETSEANRHPWIMPVVYACMNMAKTKTGALIVIQQGNSLENYERTGDRIDADINQRLIENIFFKNSPLHDGALILAKDRLAAAGCILPVSHNTDIPRSMGLRHRSALGISQATDAAAIVVSEETGGISFAHHGRIQSGLSSADLERLLNSLSEEF